MYIEKNFPLILDSTHAASKSSGSMMVRFEPQVDIREGIQRTVDWFTRPDNLKKYKSEIYNV